MSDFTSNRSDFIPHILVVDDNYQNIEIARSYLSSLNYKVSMATSGRKALSMLENELPDLIILDIMMPVMDGFEFCSIIKSKKSTQGIPVIFLTALSETHDIVKAFNYGAVDYITKPFTREEFILRVKNHVNIIYQQKLIKEQNLKLQLLNTEKDGLLQITVHDLKNPLQSILGYTDLILRRLNKSDTEGVLKFVTPLHESTLQAINIIKDLLEVNKLETGNYILETSECDFAYILSRAVNANLNHAKSKNINIKFCQHAHIAKVEVDAAKLERIFDNLISNAIKFTLPGKNIIVNCCTHDFNGKLFAIAEIIDEGPGFKEEDIPKIFTKFAKLSAKPTGEESTTGLGLSVVKKLTDAMGGEVSFETQYRRGTKFTIKFPLISH